MDREGTASSGTHVSTSWTRFVEDLKRKEKVDGRKKRGVSLLP